MNIIPINAEHAHKNSVNLYGSFKKIAHIIPIQIGPV